MENTLRGHSRVWDHTVIRKGARDQPPPPWEKGRAQVLQGLDLQDLHIGEAIRSEAAAVDDDVLQPLNVGLGVAVHFAQQLHVTACHSCGVGRESRLQDGPVRGPLWGPGQPSTLTSGTHRSTLVTRLQPPPSSREKPS